MTDCFKRKVRSPNPHPSPLPKGRGRIIKENSIASPQPSVLDLLHAHRLFYHPMPVQMLKQASWIFFSLAAVADYATLPSASRSLPGLGSLRSHGARTKIRFRMTYHFIFPFYACSKPADLCIASYRKLIKQRLVSSV